ncbi:two component system response regulator [Vibrio ostreicida]|uniref:Two component system response regulator n=1 Tax=Vibrio ostreicida TaxID=526588 RepID=A0ABT8BV43_9VIBR|nr:two component system response regulator [Vibrio ostreicida]MDN3609997.1 two component system response regulator [Vibrio ostreicida]NPD10422.1 two component system response regulator [Vibrio ostreicida]
MSFGEYSHLKILVVDDHDLIFDGLKSCLAPYPNLDIVGFVTDGLAVYEQCLKHQPHLVFMDLNLPGMSGVEAIRQLRKRWPDMMVIVLTASEEERKAREALDAGANGYVLKNGSKSTLLAAVKSVSRGKRFVDPALDAKHIEALSGVDEGDIPVLTPREKQVLKLIFEGKRNRDIAESLLIGLKTVETHRMNIMRKLDAHNVADLMKWAQRMGV